MKQKETKKPASKYALKKRAKRWGVLRPTLNKYDFTGTYKHCFAFIMKTFPTVESPDKMIVRRMK